MLLQDLVRMYTEQNSKRNNFKYFTELQFNKEISQYK
jgi:hypothetical protein